MRNRWWWLAETVVMSLLRAWRLAWATGWTQITWLTNDADYADVLSRLRTYFKYLNKLNGNHWYKPSIWQSPRLPCGSFTISARDLNFLNFHNVVPWSSHRATAATNSTDPTRRWIYCDASRSIGHSGGPRKPISYPASEQNSFIRSIQSQWPYANDHGYSHGSPRRRSLLASG
jgi:hypothetical protein